MTRLSGQSALVTGASSGFGRAIALACADAGADVALVARREEALQEVAHLIQAKGRQALVCVADVADESQVMAAVDKAVDHFGRVDLLVNSAGTNFPQRSIADTTSEIWRQHLDVNLTSAFLFTRALLPGMMERQHGAIINLASRAAIHPDLPSGVGYATAKMGMDALTRITNEEANPHNVRACLLAPGVGDTPLLDRRPSPPPPEARKEMLQPEDLADTVIFVATLPQRVNIEQIVLKPTRV